MPRNNKSRNFKKDGRTAGFKGNRCTNRSENHFEWMNHYPHLLDTATQYLMSEPLGTHTNAPFALTLQSSDGVYPGIFIAECLPTYGISRSENDVLNRTAQKIFSFAKHKVSGIQKEMQPADFMMYIPAIDNVYMFINTMRRLYGILNQYDSKNWYLGKPLVKAMGFDFDDLRANRPQLRDYLNNLINDANAFALPQGFDIVKRHAWVTSFIFADSDNPKDQIYLYNPTHFGIWKPDTENGSKIDWTEFFYSGWGPITFDRIKHFGDDMVARLRRDDDIARISAIMIQAFGDDLYKVQVIPEDYAVRPVVDVNACMAIHNADIVTLAARPVITQDPDNNLIKFEPTYMDGKLRADYATEYRMVDFTDQFPFNTENATRVCINKVAFAPNGAIAACGPEIITNVKIMIMNPNNGQVDAVYYPRTSEVLDTALQPDVLRLIAKNAAACFKYSPLVPYSVIYHADAWPDDEPYSKEFTGAITNPSAISQAQVKTVLDAVHLSYMFCKPIAEYLGEH